MHEQHGLGRPTRVVAPPISTNSTERRIVHMQSGTKTVRRTDESNERPSSQRLATESRRLTSSRPELRMCDGDYKGVPSCSVSILAGDLNTDTYKYIFSHVPPPRGLMPFEQTCIPTSINTRVSVTVVRKKGARYT